MNRLTVILLIILSQTGCDRPPEAPETPLSDYPCTKDQLELVRIELELCDKTSYLSSHCFRQAKKAYCVAPKGL